MVLTIHRFAHQSARRKSSGRASAAKFHVFSARLLRQVSKHMSISHYYNSQAELGLGTVMGLWWGSGMGIDDGDWGAGA